MRFLGKGDLVPGRAYAEQLHALHAQSYALDPHSARAACEGKMPGSAEHERIVRRATAKAVDSKPGHVKLMVSYPASYRAQIA